ncbi:FecR family protein [Mariniphaga anaerophila]|uniref:FecR family protein n=1 Tax=Mariniphaga anaerophila TaxID=1484053 RepID=A0A1M5CLB5_9BACT|nr:FecR family protein [Mariniphaga anaerophila]SHF55565.1 FecR family protein [Mariniphaga anaerophila]
MGNNNENKIEEFVGYLHGEDDASFGGEHSDSNELNDVRKIFSLRKKVKQTLLLKTGQEAWTNVEQRMKSHRTFRVKKNLNYFRYAAAILAIVTLTGVLAVLFFQSPFNKGKEIVTEIISGMGEMKEVVLPDGTVVGLGSNTVIKYSSSFGRNSREVVFSGEAMFNVKKDETSPFFVKMGDARIQVLGTKFLVTSFAKVNRNEVVLLEGNVQYKRNNHNISMSAGERITDDLILGNVVSNQVDVSRYVEWTAGKVYLDNDLLEYLVFLMEQWYGIPFEFGSEDIKDYCFSGVINKNKTLEYNLNIISLTNKIKFKQDENRIIVKKRA